jgi:PAS domain S-box-containing protein
MTGEQLKIRTILIVDDTPANISLLEAILSDEYITRAATNGVEALEIARSTLPDLILLDIMMPGMNGYEVCMELKKDIHTKNIPVIFITALLNPGDEARGFEAGGSDFITKPVNCAVVCARVKAHLALKAAQEGLEEWNDSLKKRLWKNISTLRSRTEELHSLELLKDEIQDAREYAEDIVETVREPLVVLNASLQILTANVSFYNTFKVTPDETIGNFIYDLGNKQWDIPKLRVLLDEILIHRLVFYDYEVEHDFQDIGRKTILLNARQIYRKKIGANIILLALEDITVRKQLEEERDRLATIVEYSNDAIFSISRDDVVTSWNRGAEAIFGYSPGEIIGSPIFKLIPADRYHERTSIHTTILQGEKVENFETTRLKKDGSRIHVSITTSPMLNSNGIITGNSVIARDVTGQRKPEKIPKSRSKPKQMVG